jgi:hypothetical protein
MAIKFNFGLNPKLAGKTGEQLKVISTDFSLIDLSYGNKKYSIVFTAGAQGGGYGPFGQFRFFTAGMISGHAE